jgi:hypothetical protein
MKLIDAFRSFVNVPKNKSAVPLALAIESCFGLRVGPDKVTNTAILALAGI